MTGKRMLVTGGAGFIESHVIETALAEGWAVAVLDNLSSGKRPNLPLGVPIYEADVRNLEAVQAAMADFRPTVIMLHRPARERVCAIQSLMPKSTSSAD